MENYVDSKYLEIHHSSNSTGFKQADINATQACISGAVAGAAGGAIGGAATAATGAALGCLTSAAGSYIESAASQINNDIQAMGSNTPTE